MPNKISLIFKTFQELGPKQLGYYALYKLGLKTGYFRWRTDYDLRMAQKHQSNSIAIRPIFNLPDSQKIISLIGPDGVAQLISQADEIIVGKVRLFGGKPVPLILTPPGELSHWTESESHFSGDIKYVWEPARFGWVFILGRAYHLTRDERYPEAFWRYFEQFQAANPVNLGPNWESAQEVALRLFALVFAHQIFTNSSHSTNDRVAAIMQSMTAHASRIPATLIYARAQNNNHLLSEAVGLITAGLALAEHPQAKKWTHLGWKWFNRGLETQIAEDGTYMQQSTNYHRLMLQLVLWVFAIQPEKIERTLSQQAIRNLKTATHWLLSICDTKSGRAPNLGPNDGAYIFPFTILPFCDYRSVLQAAANTLLGQPVFEPGPWDEMNLWLEIDSAPEQDDSLKIDSAPIVIRSANAWGYLRTARFTDRPGHADQLHLDLWWRGMNVAQDPGTYLYNAPAPWDNALMHTAVHNTVLVDNRQQMTRAGRFLYLDRSQGELIARETATDESWERFVTRHDGYLKAGILHNRSVTAFQNDRWLIEDLIQPLSDTAKNQIHTLRLHWLLPDWPYEIEEDKLILRIQSPLGWILIQIQTDLTENTPCNIQLLRAGERIYGVGEISPTWGWASPTYGVKEPALSLAFSVSAQLPVLLKTEWRFPDG